MKLYLVDELNAPVTVMGCLISNLISLVMTITVNLVTLTSAGSLLFIVMTHSGITMAMVHWRPTAVTQAFCHTSINTLVRKLLMILSLGSVLIKT